MSTDRVMLLIDADNVSVDVMEQGLRLLLNQHGAVHVRRAYCTAESAVKHQAFFKRMGIKPMVNLAAGKNSTDIAMAVDAIDLVLAERPDVVVIASSDSDFAPLVQRLREKGCVVRGIGQAGKTGQETQEVYDDYTVLEHRKSEASADAPTRSSRPARKTSTTRKTTSTPAATPAAKKAPPARKTAKAASSGRTRSAERAAAPEVNVAPQMAEAPPVVAESPVPSASLASPASPASAETAEKTTEKAAPAKKAAAKKTPAARKTVAAKKTSRRAAAETVAAEPVAPEPTPAPAPLPAPEPAPTHVAASASARAAQAAPAPANRGSRGSSGDARGGNGGSKGGGNSGGQGGNRGGMPLQTILDCLPELQAGERLPLNVAAQRLREAHLLSKSGSSLKLFAQFPDRFELQPPGKPSQVRLRA